MGIYQGSSDRNLNNDNSKKLEKEFQNKNTPISKVGKSSTQVSSVSKKGDKKIPETNNYTYLDAMSNVPTNNQLDLTTNMNKILPSQLGKVEDDNWKEIVFKIKLTEAEYKFLLKEKSNAVEIKY
jgi:hypothetical protein